MATAWYVRIGEKTHGPISLDKLKELARAGKLTEKTQVRKGEQGEWYPGIDVGRRLLENSSDRSETTTGKDQQASQSTTPKKQPGAKKTTSTGGKKRLAKKRRPVEALLDPDDVFETADPDVFADVSVGDYEDYDGYGDDYGDYGTPIGPAASQKSRSKQKWKLVRVGMLIVAVAMCGTAVASTFMMVTELLNQVGVLMAKAAVPSKTEDPKLGERPERPRFLIFARSEQEREQYEREQKEYEKKAEEYNKKLEKHREKLFEEQKQLMERARSAASIQRAGRTMFKVSQVMGVVAAVVAMMGYGFCLSAPNKNGSLGFAIALLLMGITNLVLRIFFQLIPAFDTLGSKGLVYHHMLFSLLGGKFVEAGDKLLGLLFDLSYAAELILLGFFFVAAARAVKKNQHADDCMAIVWAMGAYAGALFVIYMFLMFDFAGEWQFYVSWLFHWGVNAALGFGLFLIITHTFKSWNLTR